MEKSAKYFPLPVVRLAQIEPLLCPVWTSQAGALPAARLVSANQVAFKNK